MALSMTGYGRAEEILHGKEIIVEIKSVNSRYFEYYSRLPRSCNFLDDMMKKTISSKVSRGKVELNLNIQNLDNASVEISANLPVAKGYHNAILEISKSCGIQPGITASGLGRFSDVFTLRRSEQDEDALKTDVLQVIQNALAQYNEMRAAEGEQLSVDIFNRLAAIEEMVSKVEEGSAQRLEKYMARLLERLQEVLRDTTIDEGRVLTEAAVFADKTAVDEETVRLRSHIGQFREILKKGGALGRKLDFLTQEVNRETNTIGSKCQEVDITRIVVEMKSEIEKIREQIQNLE